MMSVKHFTCLFCNLDVHPNAWKGRWDIIEFEDGLPTRSPAEALMHGTSFHWCCYLGWPGMPEFARTQVRKASLKESVQYQYGRVYADDDVTLLVSLPLPDHASQQPLSESIFFKATLAVTGTCILIPYQKWIEWMNKSDLVKTDSMLFNEEQEAILRLVPRLKLRTYDPDEMLAEIDLTEKARLYRIAMWGN